MRDKSIFLSPASLEATEHAEKDKRLWVKSMVLRYSLFLVVSANSAGPARDISLIRYAFFG